MNATLPRSVARGALPLLLSLLASVPGHAQQPDAPPAPAVLRLHLSDRTTEAPIAGARVAILDTGPAGETDAGGRAVLAGIAPGPRIVEVGSTGLGGTHLVLDFAPGDTLDVRLRLAPQGAAAPDADPPPAPVPTTSFDSVIQREAIRLEGIEAIAERRMMALEDVGFYQRMRLGHGVHLTRAELDEVAQFRLSDALRRINSIRVVQYRGEDIILLDRGTMQCRMRLYVDGVPLAHQDLSDVPAEDVEAMEVYRGPAETPQRFQFGPRGCGAIVIWTKRGGGR